jgi:hypothetical protein
MKMIHEIQYYTPISSWNHFHKVSAVSQSMNTKEHRNANPQHNTCQVSFMSESEYTDRICNINLGRPSNELEGEMP